MVAPPSESKIKGDESRYLELSGTSMASPHVAGLAALAYAAGARGIDGMREAFKRAGTKLPNTPDEQQGGGMIDAGKLVQ